MQTKLGRLLEKLLFPRWYVEASNFARQESEHTARTIAQCAETVGASANVKPSVQGSNPFMVRTPRGWEAIEAGCEVRQ